MKHRVKFIGGFAAFGRPMNCVQDVVPISSQDPMLPDTGFSPDVSNAAGGACSTAVYAQISGRVSEVMFAGREGAA
ncbi:hypothetical protein E7811_15405 [Aliigemmobacter aestuarii]|uniref:Uncharacterized protein n=1 Tax=Aliigemmobacter aestuarii TaxID=1445661 RepID=A0A4V3V072_9RHOB|nr:hypothetical protein [Gemmobacter aestuarii]THD82428.1 hypothetical protein E7811_15405 [Gemmobacter aestuarii]